MGDQFEALRKALEAGPTPGPWVVKGRVHSSGEAVRVESHHPGYDHHLYQVCDVLDANGYPQNEANLLLICAADPDTIRALLAERDQLRARVQELGSVARENRSRAVVKMEAELDKLRADLERTERNRDMWKEQCAQQAEKLETGILHLNAAQADARRLDWLTEQLVDTIYLDDGRIIDVGTGRIGLRDVRVEPHDLRAAIDQAMSTTMPSGGAL